jgi:hypothetical protein
MQFWIIEDKAIETCVLVIMQLHQGIPVQMHIL